MDPRGTPGGSMGCPPLKKPVAQYPPKKLYSYMMQQRSKQEELRLQQEQQQQQQQRTESRGKDMMSFPNSPAFTSSDPSSPQWCNMSPDMLISQSDDLLEIPPGIPMSPATKRIIAETNLKIFDGPDGEEMISECLEESVKTMGKNIDLFSTDMKLGEQSVLPTPPGSIDSGVHDLQGDLIITEPSAESKTAPCPGRVRGPSRHRGKSEKHLRMLQSLQSDLDFNEAGELVCADDLEDKSHKGSSGGKEMSLIEEQNREDWRSKTEPEAPRFRLPSPAEKKIPEFSIKKKEADPEVKPRRVDGRSLRGRRKSRGSESAYINDREQRVTDSSKPEGEESSMSKYNAESDDIIQPKHQRRSSEGGRGHIRIRAEENRLHRADEQLNEVTSSSASPTSASTSHGVQNSQKAQKMKVELDTSPIGSSAQNVVASESCQVCGDVAAGFHCGAYVCEACKKFFVRCLKQEMGEKFVCSRNKTCKINKETRTQCQYCRYHKCLSLGMYKPGSGPGGGKLAAEISNIPCKVCESPSSGYHFGAITCEGCKGFFRRTVKERAGIRYVCSRKGACTITANTRNICKYCRYQKCLQAGMTPDGSRIGRQPNSVKHATMLELQRIQSHGGEGPADTALLQIKQELPSPPQHVLPENAQLELVDPSKVFDSDLEMAHNVAIEFKAQQLSPKEQNRKQSPGYSPGDSHSQGNSSSSISSYSNAPKGSRRDIYTKEHSGEIEAPPPSKELGDYDTGYQQTVSHEENSEGKQRPRDNEQPYPTHTYESDANRLLSPPNIETFERTAFFGDQRAVREQAPSFVQPVTSIAPQGYGIDKPTWSSSTVPGNVREQVVHQRHIEPPRGVQHALGDSRPDNEKLEKTDFSREMNHPQQLMGPPSLDFTRRTQQDVGELSSASGLLGLEREMLERSLFKYESFEQARKEYERVKQERINRELFGQMFEKNQRVLDGMDAENIIRAKFHADYGQLYEANMEVYKSKGPENYLPVEAVQNKPSPYGRESGGSERQQVLDMNLPMQKDDSPLYNQSPLPTSESVTQQSSPLSSSLSSSSPSPSSLATHQSAFAYENNIPRNLSLPKLKTLNCHNLAGLVRRTDEELVEITAIIRKSLQFLRPISKRCENNIRLEPTMSTTQLWGAQMAQFGQCGPSVIKFAKKVPGFQKFPLQIQISKVQMSMYPIVLCILSQQFDLETETYNYFNMTDAEKNIVFAKFPGFRVLGEHLHHVGHAVQFMNLDEIEVGYLCALFLMNSSATNEESESAAPQGEADLIAGLQNYCLSKYPNDTGREGYILVRIAELSTCNLQHQKTMIQLKMEYPELEMPQLFKETYLNT